jgi:hypothetical protein
MKVAGRALPRVEGLSRKINNLDATRDKAQLKLIPQNLMWGKL